MEIILFDKDNRKREMRAIKNTGDMHKDHAKVTVSDHRNYAHDPFVLKKVQQAKIVLGKLKLPVHLNK